jgi:predicted nuclease with TOPRIM domain
MANMQEKNALEAARARLEQALSKLTQNVASSRASQETILSESASASAEQAAQIDRIQSLEQENLRLHEQVATASLQQPEASNDGRLTEVEAEKVALQQNYDLLKRQYTSLQDEFEGLQDRVSRENSGDADQNDTPTNEETDSLRRQIGSLMRERNDMRDELDTVIAELEGFLTDNKAAAGGTH